MRKEVQQIQEIIYPGKLASKLSSREDRDIGATELVKGHPVDSR
jgi:hypothetical protein